MKIFKANYKLRNSKFAVVLNLIAFLIPSTTLMAQETITTTGGGASGGGGSSSYTVGQVVYKSHFSQDGSIAEGVQHPFEIWVVTSIDEAVGITLNVSAYPNPTKHFLTLEVKDFEPTGLIFQLYDLSGNLIKSDKITSTQTTLDMGRLVPALYLLRIIKENKEVKVFKIIKN